MAVLVCVSTRCVAPPAPPPGQAQASSLRPGACFCFVARFIFVIFQIPCLTWTRGSTWWILDPFSDWIFDSLELIFADAEIYGL